MIEIIPAILTDSPVQFKDLILKIEPYVSRVHIDVADGVFVPNKTITGFEEVKGMASTGSPQVGSGLKFDVHLMVQRPQDVIKEWFFTHADRFLIHAESTVDLGGIIDDIHNNDRKVGLVLNPETEVDKIKEFIDRIDYIQFMTVHPGFQGGKFEEVVVDKIANFHKNYFNIPIIVDGGITPETALQLAAVGVSMLVAGSYIIKSGNFAEAINKLKNSCTT